MQNIIQRGFGNMLLLLLFPVISQAAMAAPQTASASMGEVRLNPVLFVQSVLAQNPNIKIQEAGHDAAVARITSAGALDDPMMSYSSAPQTIGTKMGYRQNVQISQTIPWPGTLDLRSHAASAEAKSAEYQFVDMRLRLAARARATYADWYYVYQALAINSKSIKLVTQMKTVAEAAYASGSSPQQDVLQAEIELTRLKNQTLELERRRADVRAAINALLNDDQASAVNPPGGLPAPATRHSLPDLNEAALLQYPALRGADSEMAASRDRVELAEKAYYPNFQITVGQNTLMEPWQKQLTVGISINIPIGDKHDGDFDEAQAKLRQSQFKLISTRSALLSDLEKTHAAIQQIRSTIDLYDKRLVPLARLNLNAARADYSTGTGSFLNVITAEQPQLMAELERERARADYYTQFAILDYQTGGVIFDDGQQETRP